jgi:hypothetical protein
MVFGGKRGSFAFSGNCLCFPVFDEIFDGFV